MRGRGRGGRGQGLVGRDCAAGQLYRGQGKVGLVSGCVLEFRLRLAVPLFLTSTSLFRTP